MRKAIIIAIWGSIFLLQAGLLFAGKKTETKDMPECTCCGMYLNYYRQSRMLIEHAKGHRVGTCSVNCAAVDLIKDLDDPPQSLKVGDYRTKQLIDAEKAAWVIGGDKPGVMTQRAKWAFRSKKDARKFIEKHGGQIATFEEIMKASYEDIYKDMKN